MNKFMRVLAVLGLLAFLGGCAWGNPHGAPPGQTKKATGYNPASGKMHK